jgi:hypothetical protein
MNQDLVRCGLVALVTVPLVLCLACTTGTEEEPAVHELAGHPERSSCTSYVDPSGLLCTRCCDRLECVPAECGVSDRCLRCTDPEGRTGEDCSVDYEEAYSASFGIAPSGGDTFALCELFYGVPFASGTTCHYPGTDSCVADEMDGWHCLTCSYRDGSGTSLCQDANVPLPDPLIGRPDDLPTAGSCVSEPDASGTVVCETCTRDDGSATRSCHYPGIVDCDFSNADDEAAGCLGRCTLADGQERRLCNSARGPVLVDLPAP